MSVFTKLQAPPLKAPSSPVCAYCAYLHQIDAYKRLAPLILGIGGLSCCRLYTTDHAVHKITFQHVILVLCLREFLLKPLFLI